MADMALSKAGHAALAFIWLALAALASPVSLLALSPVYGAVGAYLPHSRLVSVTALVVLASAKAMRKWVPAWSMQFAPLVAASVPLLQEQLSRYSGWLGATYGPLLTESVTLLPLLALSMYAAASELDRLGWIASSRDGEDDSGGNEGRGGAKARRAAVKLGAGSPEGGLMETVPVMAAYISFSFVEKAGLTTLPSVIGSHVVLSRVNLQLLLANLYCLLSILYSTILPRRWLGQSLPLGGRASTLKNVATYALIAYTLVYNPHRIGNERILNRALERHGYELLDREESITGYVSVLHDRTSETKLLRCDHSLLGGEWILTADRKAEGMGQSEPVFAVFAMLEAVRLLHERGSAGGGEEALVIGLGTGSCPSGLIAHGLNTTVVELDPAVYRMAVRHFGLARPHQAVIENAVSYVARTREEQPTGRFQYIVHDVFTGGAEPVDLFTYQFLDGLNELLTEDGVVAINYAGDMSQPGLGIVFDTVAEVFPNCRVFRDNPASGSGPGPGPGPRSGAEAEAESKSKSKGVAKSRASKSDFLNMVFFCRKRGNGRRIAFRAPVEEDFLGTASRRAYLLPRPDLELPFPRTLPGSGRAQRSEGRREDGTADETDSAGETAAPHRRVLGRDAAVMKELQGHHATAALEHWRLMRGLLKDVVWEMW